MDRRFDHVVFDLDGTLLDTLCDLAACCNWALAQHGFGGHDVWAYRYFVGNGSEKLVERAAPDGTPAEVLHQVFLDYRARYNEHSLDTTCPYLGVPAALDALRRAGLKLGVLSNKPQNNATVVVGRYYPGIFAAVRGNRPGVPYKPDPAALNALLDELGADKARTLFVGDSGVDIRTAKNAGLTACGVLWGFRERCELEREGADMIVRSPLELAQVVWGEQERENETADGT